MIAETVQIGKFAGRRVNADDPIYVTPDGMFHVQKGGKWLAAKTLAGARKQLGRTLKIVKLFSVDPPRIDMDECRVVDVSFVTPANNLQSVDGRNVYAGYNLYLYDEAAIAKLNALAKKIAALDKQLTKEFEAILGKNKRLVRSDIKELLK